MSDKLTFEQRALRIAEMASTLTEFAHDLEQEYVHMKAAAERFNQRRSERPTKKAAQ